MTYFPQPYFPQPYFGSFFGPTVEGISDFKIRYPEFTDVDDDRVDFFLAIAELYVDEDVWGDFYQEGLFAVTAHLLVQDLARSDPSTWGKYLTGKVSSRTIGDVAVTFKTGLSTGFAEDYWQTTSYGQYYWQIMPMVGMGIVAVT